MSTVATEATKQSSPPESPTTVRPFEMDDDDAPDTSIVEDSRQVAAPVATSTQSTTIQSTTTQPAVTEPTHLGASVDVPPQKPPRPLTEMQKKVNSLKEMFPSVDLPVIKAVLSASRGDLDPAIHALLEMTDPDAFKNEVQESTPPPQPPRPNAMAQSQLESDEQYARQLAQHYENISAYESRTANHYPQPSQQGQGGYPRRGSSRQPTQPAAHDYHGHNEREYSFIEDDLPVIRDNLRKGFVETQTRVNGWIQNLKKKIDETFDEQDDRTQGQSSTPGGRSYRSNRSRDYDRYDADPEVLGDDFAGIRLEPDGSVSPQRRSSGFRPQPSTSPRMNNRKVGFKEETEEIYDSPPRVPPKESTLAFKPAAKPATKASKWQPLTTADSVPMTENDPFSLGDSDDDKDAVKETASKPDSSAQTISVEDSERLKKAAAEAMADSLVDSKPDDSASKD